jgi:hypothetical protein
MAQRFSVGTLGLARISPEGTAELAPHFQPSLRDLFLRVANPNAEALGYCRMSLRDNNQATPMGFFARSRT